MKHKFRYHYWTEEETSLLITLYNQGLETKTIVSHFTQRTEKAVLEKIAILKKDGVSRKITPKQAKIKDIEKKRIFSLYGEKKSMSEIADMLHININTVKTVLRKIRSNINDSEYKLRNKSNPS